MTPKLKSSPDNIPPSPINDSVPPPRVSAKRPDRAARETAKEARRSAARELRHFVNQASLSDVYFVKDVLVNWNSAHFCEDLGIVTSFSEAIRGDQSTDEYFRVPEKHARAVRHYITHLQSGAIIPVGAGDSDAQAAAPSTLCMPRSIRLSEDERAYVACLVRLLRDNYWVSELVRQILTMESKATHQLTIKKLTALLDDFSTVEALASNARRLGNNWSNHPILRAIREEWPEIESYKDECAIRALVESAKK
jgi:hypothetical protein